MEVNNTQQISRHDIMMNNQIEFKDRTSLLSIFNKADTDANKGTLTGDEIGAFINLVVAEFKDKAGSVLSLFGLKAPTVDNSEGESVETNPDSGSIPPKSSDGSLTPEQVDQYIQNAPRCKSFREYLANCNDTTRRMVIEHDLERLHKVLTDWVDTPKDADVSSSFYKRSGSESTVFTNIRRETLPDGTKVYNTEQGYFNLWFDGMPGGKRMTEEELRQHGYCPD